MVFKRYMKKIIFTLFLLSMLPLHSFSQCDSVKTLYYAITAGIGPSNVRMERGEALDKKPIFHFHVGAVVDYTLFKNFFIESGLSVQHKGYQEKHVGTIEWEKERFTVNYLQVPLTANYRLPFQNIWVTPQLGFYYAVALKGRYTREGEWMDEDVKKYYSYYQQIYDVKRRYRRFDWGMSMGVNILFMQKYRLGMMYDLGFLNIDKSKISRVVDLYNRNNEERKNKNGVFTVQFGYYLDVNKWVNNLKQKRAEKRQKESTNEITEPLNEDTSVETVKQEGEETGNSTNQAEGEIINQ